MFMKRPMSNPSMLDKDRPVDPNSPTTTEPDESFGDILSEYEQSHTHRIREEGKRGLEGTVVAVSGESVLLDIGFKTEGIIPLAEFQATGDSPKLGDKMPVSIKGRDPEGYYELSRIKVERPKDWSALEKVFADKSSGFRRGQRRRERGCGRSRFHAGVTQRRPRCRRNGKARRPGNSLPHHQARRCR